MPTRNTVVLKRIVEALGIDALTRLEAHFQNELLTVVSAQQIARHAEQLRLEISESECAVVLDHIAHEITIDQVEDAINAHHLVIESAVVGFPHPIKGQGLYAFVICMGHSKSQQELEKEIRDTVQKVIGPIAKPDILAFG